MFDFFVISYVTYVVSIWNFFSFFFLVLVESDSMSDSLEIVLKLRRKPHSMSFCLPLLHQPKYLIRAHSHFVLMRAAIRPCSSSINSAGDVQNQIMQLLHYSGIIWLSGAVLVSLDLITDVIGGQLGAES